MAFVKEGATVAIADLNEEVGQQTLKELQQYAPDSMFIPANLAERDKLAGIVQQVVDRLGKLDILVNNAHASRMVSIAEMTQEHLDLSFNTGFYPTLYLMQAALPYLKETKGNIINFASGAGINGDVNQGSYAAAKEAIRGLPGSLPMNLASLELTSISFPRLLIRLAFNSGAQSIPKNIKRC